jgi:hypothetical protein
MYLLTKMMVLCSQYVVLCSQYIHMPADMVLCSQCIHIVLTIYTYDMVLCSQYIHIVLTIYTYDLVLCSQYIHMPADNTPLRERCMHRETLNDSRQTGNTQGSKTARRSGPGESEGGSGRDICNFVIFNSFKLLLFFFHLFLPRCCEHPEEEVGVGGTVHSDGSKSGGSSWVR